MSVDDPAFIKLATTWVETCSREHEECLVLHQTYRPTRLIHIVDAGHVRLTTSNKEASAPYVAFSHCWGKVQTIKLLESNVREFRAGLPLAQLPNTYQEAIRLCREIGLHYIWIDSLCIIQDSAEDWAREAKDMKLVYGHTFFNLCSATASDSSGRSFIRRKPKLLVPENIAFNGTTFQLIYDNQFYENVAYCTLRSRAWVYQEWYLSKRSLILGSRQLWWHCRKQLACEIRPNGAPMCSRGLWWKEAKEMKEDNTMPDNPNSLCTTWYERVKEYARTKLTTGLWRAHLPAALCWAAGSPTKRSTTYMAPSWSWASLEGDFILEVDDDLLQKQCFASIRRV
ncbi:HET domain-containing protein [Fusarium keratoplasticum]|uniref:HET domain-containing protein n=1 Tax=Fusarium keratoplasticum TaxID=1328300 RepID=A0ACC0QS79_9HYPO|nr:HET domain-containing protein [Fusarium keratoplasticum]KAI8663362.1 HET domain-containing protein [Fusarium keratoplasticum]